MNEGSELMLAQPISKNRSQLRIYYDILINSQEKIRPSDLARKANLAYDKTVLKCKELTEAGLLKRERVSSKKHLNSKRNTLYSQYKITTTGLQILPHLKLVSEYL